MKLSVVIPVYNEAATIGLVLKRVKAELERLIDQKHSGIHAGEIVVVDDGSDDNSFTIVSKQTSRWIKAIKLSKNQGKGKAIRTGFEQASGDIVLIQDADLEYSPEYYSQLIGPIVRGETHVVYGSRLRQLQLNLKNIRSIKLPLHFVSNKLLSFLTTCLYGQTITDMETGYKAITKSALENISLKTNKFDIEVELTAKLIKAGYTITEIDIQTQPRGYHEGKKIGFFDGVMAVVRLLQYVWSSFHTYILSLMVLGLLLHGWNFPFRYQFTPQFWQSYSLSQGQVSTLPPLVDLYYSLADWLFGIWGYWVSAGLLVLVSCLSLLWISWYLWGKRAAIIMAFLAFTSLGLLNYHLQANWLIVLVWLSTWYLGFGSLYRSTHRIWQLAVAGVLLGSLAVTHILSFVVLIPSWMGLLGAKKLTDEKLFIVNSILTVPLGLSWLFRFESTSLWLQSIPRSMVRYVLTWDMSFSKFVAVVDFLTSVVGGNAILGIVSLLLGIGVSSYIFIQKTSAKETVYVSTFVWLVALIILTPANMAFLSLLLPLVLLFMVKAIDYASQIDGWLGAALLAIVLVNHFLVVAEQTRPVSARWPLSSIESILVDSSPRFYQVYDYEATPTICSKMVQFVLQEHDRLSSSGIQIGTCLQNDCAEVRTLLVEFNSSQGTCIVVELEE